MPEKKQRPTILPDDIYELLLKYLQTIQFGSVTLVIQNGKVVQIESNEKIRTDKK
ncbi:MAG: YezD family protein [Ruminococcus sp.]|nr:YezD family protein [Ruminococcus sp.]